MMLKKIAHLAPTFDHASDRTGLRHKLRLLGAVTVTAALLAGCGLRLETDVPQPLTPDSNELARQAMVNDFALIQQDAHAALAAEAPNSEVASTLTALIDRNAQYEELLGGVYNSGLPQDDSALESPAPAPSTAATSSAGQEVIDRILASTGRLRATLELAEDPELARLQTSMTIGNLVLAQQLATTAGLAISPPEFLGEPAQQPDLALLSQRNVSALVQNEDAAGYSLEVIAAMQDPQDRTTALQQAQVHRDNAEFWAGLAATTETFQDPRTAAYALPLALSAEVPVASPQQLRELAQTVTSELATGYVDLIALAPPDSRMFYFDYALRTMYLDLAWGQPSGPLPYFSSSEQFLSPSTEDLAPTKD